jgi:hypothetical protein
MDVSGIWRLGLTLRETTSYRAEQHTCLGCPCEAKIPLKSLLLSFKSVLEVLLLYPHERLSICLSPSLDSVKPSRQFQGRPDVIDKLVV